jgi:hypothetical protein
VPLATTAEIERHTLRRKPIATALNSCSPKDSCLFPFRRILLVRRTLAALPLLLALALPAPAQQPNNPREKKVRDDKAKVEAAGYWIYNDLPRAFAEAKATGKPIVVVLRCLPCEECVKLDDDLVNTDPVLKPLLEKYVRVRVVSTNSLDLSLFQFDYDQSFAVFLLNADGTIYGRFGTRSHRTDWIGDVSLPGMAKALEGGLELHAAYPKNKDVLAGKRGPAPEFPTPEKFPMLTGKYGPKLNYEGNVVQSCIHCHQVGDAQKNYYRAKKEAIPEHVLFPYPHPKSQGLVLDPKERATVLKVEPGSPAEKAGLRAGDALLTLDGQPLLSMADVQWVLHRTPAEGKTILAEITRGGAKQSLTLYLPAGWRRKDEIGWRSSTWGLRRMATGGMVLETPTERPAGVPTEGMALRVKSVGQYGPHAAAKNAGFQPNDVIVAFDGKTDLTRETDLIVHAVTVRKAGETVKVTVIRGGKPIELTLPMQE